MILSVLSKPEDMGKLSELIFREATTLGIRVNRLASLVSDREVVKVETKRGEVEVKVARVGIESWDFHPSFARARR